jgi:hypothetical protein
MSRRLVALETGAPDVVGAWRSIDDEASAASVRARIAASARAATVSLLVPQLAATASALAAVVATLPDRAFMLPGGERDWNVAEAIGHAADARAGLALAASLAASGRWPASAPPVVPGVPGPPDAEREALVRRIATSQRIVERSARSIAGHEHDPCPLDHPLVGRLRCGEWLLFAGVHDLMHLEQLERLEAEA